MSAPEPEALDTARSRAKDKSPWNWLLFIPIVVPLIPALFNADSPRLFGFPRFYWLQLAWILLGVGTTTLVYQMTKKRGDR
ncbi:DUF3311 domain-containing protein [Micromonospora aurantiaca]|uniref:DUF3311 domain-containing protein n=1 Tax=Micromonospora aurantiaca (nom. illeg.) TaxID=47850 RepID=A0A6N9XZ16_9ACTN|nr:MULTISPECIES: DUF3311 domain-containing protein [Micromonospora]AXH94211.1 DUF3311 domain-containing protein [Micromonospora aurantiaca]MDG4753452.1 DUF3311 domain-containing protein [Micromonospora sp. WMMD718]NED52402.1 DUF3311 domain-containing protein [Micromonospora aurantiaca]